MTKYKAIKVDCPIHGKFDSKAEYARFQFLLQMKAVGEIIGEIERQIPYKLEVNSINICKLIPDFEFTLKNGFRVIEDVKGIITPVAKLKIKLFEALFNKKITIVTKTKQWY